MMIDNLLVRLDLEPRERLRWRVLREFKVLPGSREDKRLSDVDCVICGLHMLLDMQRGQVKGAGYTNPAFDPERFEKLKGGSV